MSIRYTCNAKPRSAMHLIWLVLLFVFCFDDYDYLFLNKLLNNSVYVEKCWWYTEKCFYCLLLCSIYINLRTRIVYISLDKQHLFGVLNKLQHVRFFILMGQLDLTLRASSLIGSFFVNQSSHTLGGSFLTSPCFIELAIILVCNFSSWMSNVNVEWRFHLPSQSE